MTDQLLPSDSDNTPDQWDAISRFLAGESNPVDAAEIRRWLAEHPDDAIVVARLDALLPVPSADSFRSPAGAIEFTGPVDVEGALRRVHARIQTPASAPVLTPRPLRSMTRVSRGRSLSSRWLGAGVAAAATLMVAMGVTNWRGSKQPSNALAMTYDSKAGAADSIVLPDSSTVILAPGSHLVVAGNYGTDMRDVELQGTGQFTVRHDAKRPFTVRSGSAIIRDLGTVFSVRPSAGAGITVAVSQGSVALSDSSASKLGQSIELKAGDRGHLLADGSVKSERGAVTPDELSWVSGTLVYHDTPLAEVQADLRHWFSVELVVRDSAWASQTISTRGVTSEPVGKIIERVAAIWGGTVTVRGDTAFIDRAGVRSKH